MPGLRTQKPSPKLAKFRLPLINYNAIIAISESYLW